MKFLALIFFLLSFTANAELIDPELKPYVESFIDNSQGKVSPEDLDGMSIKFVDYKDNGKSSETLFTVATCYLRPWRTNYITVNRWWWAKNTGPMWNINKEVIIWHELGHCVLDREHTTSDYDNPWYEKLFKFLGLQDKEKSLSDGCPTSIMYPYVLPTSCLIEHEPYYIKELYTSES